MCAFRVWEVRTNIYCVLTPIAKTSYLQVLYSVCDIFIHLCTCMCISYHHLLQGGSVPCPGPTIWGSVVQYLVVDHTCYYTSLFQCCMQKAGGPGIQSPVIDVDTTWSALAWLIAVNFEPVCYPFFTKRSSAWPLAIAQALVISCLTYGEPERFKISLAHA